MNIYNLADYILGKYPYESITPMKLQKLAYYCKVWTLVAGKHTVAADFQKWDYGPVNISLYKRYQKYGKNVIPTPKVTCFEMPADHEYLLKFILDNYVHFSVFALSSMTHSEDPWVKTEPNKIISEACIVEYYSTLPFAKNFSKGSLTNGPFYLLKSDNWHAFTLDMSEDEAASFESYSSYEEYLKLHKKAEGESKDFLHELFS